MARSRRVRRAGGRGPKNNVWSVVLIENQVVDTTTIEGDIVNSGDLQAAASGFQRFTLLRIRGWLSVSRVSCGVSRERAAIERPRKGATGNTICVDFVVETC